MTTFQIEISDQKAAALKTKATRRGISPEEYVGQMLDCDLEGPGATSGRDSFSPYFGNNQ